MENSMKKIVALSFIFMMGNLHAITYHIYNDTAPKPEYVTGVEQESPIKGGRIKIIGAEYGNLANFEKILNPGESFEYTLKTAALYQFDVEGLDGDIKGLNIRAIKDLTRADALDIGNNQDFRAILVREEEQNSPKSKKIKFWLECFSDLGAREAKENLVKSDQQKYKIITCE